MKIAYIIPGFGGGYYCGNCAGSSDMIQAFGAREDKAVLVPMYMPFDADAEPENLHVPVFFGAINVYLEEKFPLSKFMPRWLGTAFNSETLLRWLSHRVSAPNPAGLEKMTISVMKGESGGQEKELHRLVAWLKNDIKPDVVHLSNSLLIGIAVNIKNELGIPVFCNLDDEGFWLDEMSEPYSSTGWKLIESGAAVIDGFISSSRYHADLVLSKINIPADMVHVVPKGVFPDRYLPGGPAADPPVIGFLSRMSAEYGLDILADACVLVKKNTRHKKLKLKVTGGMGGQDKKYFKDILKRLAGENMQDDIEPDPYLFRKDINGFFKSLSLLCVPSRKGSSFGGFLLEAMACGVPAVVPAVGAYPETIQRTGGGIIYGENTPENLADVIAGLLDDPGKLERLGRQGMEAVKQCSMEKMITDLIGIYSRNSGGTPGGEKR